MHIYHVFHLTSAVFISRLILPFIYMGSIYIYVYVYVSFDMILNYNNIKHFRQFNFRVL